MIIKDKVLLGAIIGLAADTVKLTVNYLLFLFNFTPVIFWQLTASRFLDEKYLYDPVAYLIGGVADLTVSAAFGVLFVYLIQLLGRKYLLIKGIGFAMFIWVAVFGTLLGQSVAEKLPQEPAGIVVTIIAHFFYGVALSFLTSWLYKPQRV